MKQIILENKYSVSLIKRKGSKSIRLTYSPINGIRVTFPVWVSYSYALKFVNSKIEFIKKNYKSIQKITNYTKIGFKYNVKFLESDSEKFSFKIKENIVYINKPAKYSIFDELTQEYSRKICLKILRDEAEDYLPKRLLFLSKLHNFNYNQVNIRILKSRWGSCDSKKNITLNMYLMQVPNYIVDYVLIHELVHTTNMSHDKTFWKRVELLIPKYKDIKKELKTLQPIL